jgi:N-acylneuraminate cytidylyltransferase
LIDQPYFREILNQPTTLQHVLESIHDEVENVIVLQPTNPLRSTKFVKDCFEKFQNEKVDSLFTVTQNHQKFEKLNQDLCSVQLRNRSTQPRSKASLF